jgi:hypothetical protein
MSQLRSFFWCRLTTALKPESEQMSKVRHDQLAETSETGMKSNRLNLGAGPVAEY